LQQDRIDLYGAADAGLIGLRNVFGAEVLQHISRISAHKNEQQLAVHLHKRSDFGLQHDSNFRSVGEPGEKQRLSDVRRSISWLIGVALQQSCLVSENIILNTNLHKVTLLLGLAKINPLKRVPKILLFLAIGHMAVGQTKVSSCNCPTTQDLAHQGAPEKVFYLSNGNQIGLCGDIEKVDKDTIYSEVILYHCGAEGFFRGWDDNKTCMISQNKDTIEVRQLVTLPVGKNMELVSTSFKIEKFFYRGSRFVVSPMYRTDLAKYTASQVKDALDQYSGLVRGDYDKILLVERKLFWAYVSGSADAGRYLDSFEQKFGPFTGARSNEFEEVHGLYWFWKFDHMMARNELPVP